MLTTFNEVDMSAIMRIRQNHQDAFRAKHGIKLGFMSFFTSAASRALAQFPMVNSRIDDEEIVSPNFIDIGIAVQTPKGLMVPVLRNVEVLSLPQIEQQISAIAEKARAGRISPTDLDGGTFTITNGGIFGSLLSTPIINPPQSGILGMHNIVDRPVAVNGKVEIRPMMYIALSYDHRIIDGRDSVGFLVMVKNLLENPERLLIEGDNPEKLLLGL
jgi:2-oxoglutarate dehydrogenase E2 component (dihydrolipoamide succinyltransferase)